MRKNFFFLDFGEIRDTYIKYIKYIKYEIRTLGGRVIRGLEPVLTSLGATDLRSRTLRGLTFFGASYQTIRY